MPRRLDWANGCAGRAGDRDMMVNADNSLGTLLRSNTSQAIHRAAPRHEAMTLPLTSPEFHRC